MINAKEAYELSMNSINMLCDTAIKEAACAGKFAAKVSLKNRNFTDREVWETMKKLNELGYHTYPYYVDDGTKHYVITIEPIDKNSDYQIVVKDAQVDRIYSNLDELTISWR